MLKTELIWAMEISSLVPIVVLGIVLCLSVSSESRRRLHLILTHQATGVVLAVAWLWQGLAWMAAALSIHRDIFWTNFHMSTSEFRRAADPLWRELAYYAAAGLFSLFALSIVIALAPNRKPR